MTPTGSNLGIGIAYAIPLPSLTGGPGPAPKWEAFDGDLHGNGAKRTEVERAHAASKTGRNLLMVSMLDSLGSVEVHQLGG